MTTQLIADDSDLTAWALEHGPEYLRYAAEQKYTVKSGTMTLIGARVAECLLGKLVSELDLVDWRPREHADAAWVARWEDLHERLRSWRKENTLPDGTPLPAQVTFELTTVVRVEEQLDPERPQSLLKYTGVVVKVRHPATIARIILKNFEA